MDDHHIEHLATLASELGDHDTEALCDEALAGLTDPVIVEDIARDDPRYVTWMERGRNLGWRRRVDGTAVMHRYCTMVLVDEINGHRIPAAAWAALALRMDDAGLRVAANDARRRAARVSWSRAGLARLAAAVTC